MLGQIFVIAVDLVRTGRTETACVVAKQAPAGLDLVHHPQFGRYGRARERGHDDRGHDRDIAEAAADVADPGHRHGDDPPRHAAGVHEFAGQHEEGDGHQNEVVGAVDGVLRDQLRIEHVHVQHQCDAADHQREHLVEASSNLNEFMQTMQRNLKFTVDEVSGESVIAVHDAKTDELIRQIPSKEALELIHNMDKVLGLLFKAEA